MLEALIALSIITMVALSITLGLKQYSKWTTTLTKNRENLRIAVNTIETDKAKMTYQFDLALYKPIYINSVTLKNTKIEWLSND